MSYGRYVIDENGNPKHEPDLFKWATWFEKSKGNRIVKQEQVGRYWISTVFLGLDHGWDRDGSKPVVWETMSFRYHRGGEEDMDRCSGNREQAEAMHDRMVKKFARAEGFWWVSAGFLFTIWRIFYLRVINRIWRKIKPIWCRWLHSDHWKMSHTQLRTEGGTYVPRFRDEIGNEILCTKCYSMPFYGRSVPINTFTKIRKENNT